MKVSGKLSKDGNRFNVKSNGQKTSYVVKTHTTKHKMTKLDIDHDDEYAIKTTRIAYDTNGDRVGVIRPGWTGKSFTLNK